MFNELEGVTSIVILDSENKEVIEGAKVQINNLSNFSDDKGTALYHPTQEELTKESIIPLIIKKGSYLTYQGNFRSGIEKKVVYLERDKKMPVENIGKTENVKEINSSEKKKILSSKVKIRSSDSGILYLGDKKLRDIDGGRESFFRIREGIITLTLDTEKFIYRKEIKVVAPEILITFTNEDIIKIKELPVAKPIEKVAIIKPVKKTQENSVDIPEEITNEYLIEKIIGPIESGKAFIITTNSNCFEMEEDEDKGAFVSYKDDNGNTGKMNKDFIRNTRNKIGKNELLDNYYYIIADLEIRFDEDYLNEVNKILDKIAIEKKEYISTNSNWSTENDGKYIAFSSSKRIDNDKILDKLYRISYKNTKQYSDFFEKLNSTIRKKREYQIRLYDNNSPTVVFNMKINGNHYYNINTTLGNKEISSNYSSMGSYLDGLSYTLLGSLYNQYNNYYFLNGSIAKINVHFLKENDGRKIIKSEYKKVM
jgi:hypothetical protein